MTFSQPSNAFASAVTATAGATLAASFPAAAVTLLAECLAVVAVYIGTLGAGTCADSKGNALTLGSSTTGGGWTVSTFYLMNLTASQAGATGCTFTAPGSVANKGIAIWRTTPSNQATFADSKTASLATNATDGITTGLMALAGANDGAFFGGAIDLIAASTLSNGTSMTDDGLIWNSFGRANHRFNSADTAATLTNSSNTNTTLIGGVAFKIVPGGQAASFGPGVSPRKMTMFVDSPRSTVLPATPVGPPPSFGPGISPRKFTMFYDSPRSTTIVAAGSIFSRVLEDDLVIGEGTVRYAMRAQLQGDSAVVSDNLPTWTRRVATVTDAVTVGDAVVYWRRLLRSLEEDLTIGEGTVLYLQRVRSQGDTAIVSDGLPNWTRRVALASDVLTVADAALARSIRMRLAEDDLALADALITIRQQVRVLADSLTVFDERLSGFFPGTRYSLGPTRLGAAEAVRLGSRQEIFTGARDDNRLGGSQEVGLGVANDIRLGSA